MDFRNDDADVFNYVNPLLVQKYLLENGWVEVQKVEDRSVILYTYNETGRKFSIMLPLNKDIPDFSYRMAEAFKTLETFEQKVKIRMLSDFVDSILSD